MNKKDYEVYHEKGGYFHIPVEIFDDLLDERDSLQQEKENLIKYLENKIKEFDLLIQKNAKIGIDGELVYLAQQFWFHKEILEKVRSGKYE